MIIFRTDAGPQIGFGHLTRCRALAHALRELGEQCVMVGPLLTYANESDKLLFSVWEPLSWKSAEADALCLAGLAKHFDATKLVLDDYRVNEAYQLVLRENGLKWLQFEACTEQPIWADMVLNASPAARTHDYAEVLRNPNTHLLLGPSYAVLRPEFSNVKRRVQVRKVERVLATFGGGDDRGAVEFTLSALLAKTSSSIHFRVMSGKHNPRNAQLTEWVSTYGGSRVSMIIDPQNVSELFSSCDIAIMAGGSSTYEAASCGLPMILIAIADNQIPQSQGWDALKVSRFLGHIKSVREDDLVDVFIALCRQEELRQAMSVNAKRTVNGKGASYVAQFIKNFEVTL